MNSLIDNAMNNGKGVLQMFPDFVPRGGFRAGQRLKMHPDDLHAFGAKAGTIVERWFSATGRVEVPHVPEDTGMSNIYYEGQKTYFVDAVKELGKELIGEELMEKHGTWPMFSKFYDYENPSFHHLHPDEKAASCVPGAKAKPEAYYFPVQMNMSVTEIATTFIGFDPSVTKEEVIDRLKQFGLKNNRITELSRAFRLELGTGWYTPPGVLHACGSYCTYEPQLMSDSAVVYENYPPGGDFVDENQMTGLVPDGVADDIEYVISMMDWDANFDPNYRKHYFRPPIVEEETSEYVQKWITYGNPYFGAKELTVYPGKKVTIKDKAAYGCIIIEGYGRFGVYKAESPSIIRFGQPTCDEFFVSEQAAKEGVTIENNSTEPMVILKHFSENCGMPDAPKD